MAGGQRSRLLPWVGGLSAPVLVPPPNNGGYRSRFLWWMGGLSAPAGVIPPEPPVVVVPGTGSSGGRYLPAPGDYGQCWREIRKLETERKRVERRIKRLEQKVDDKEERLQFESSMATLKALAAQLGILQGQIAALYGKLAEIEAEEMMMLTVCLDYYRDEWLH